MNLAQQQDLAGTATLFHKEWWLNAVSNERWRQVVVMENSTVAASLPYYEWTYLGRRVIGMPPLTRTLGPSFPAQTPQQKFSTSKQFRLIAGLVQQLPRHVFFRQILPPDFTCAVGFQIEGFAVSCECVVQIDCRRPAEQIWSEIATKTRRQIKLTERLYSVHEIGDSLEFYDFYKRNLEKAGRQIHFEKALIIAVHQACVDNQAGAILGLRDSAGNLAAAIFIAWCDRTMHFLLQTRDPSSTAGAIERLLCNAMERARERHLTLDLDGIPNAETARRLTRLGGTLRQRTIVTNGNLVFSTLRNLNRGLKWKLGNRELFP